MLLAHCHANLGELAEALVWCERALATTKTDPTLHFLRAGILQELQHDEEALLALRNVLFLDPGHVLAHFTMANLHRRHNRKPAAAKHLANVRQLLAQRDENEELPQSGGLTVGRLNAILTAVENAERGTGKAEGKTLELWTPRSELRVPRSTFRAPTAEGMTHE
jgi:chemotaxis protein methyltransferase CheR